MIRRDLLLYAVHAGFWASFGIVKQFVGAGAASPDAAPATGSPATARFSRAVLAVHFVAFGVMYMGIGAAVFGRQARVLEWLPGQRIVATLIIAAGAWMMCWSLLHFRSWRFRAALEAGHELATGGPYALVRHPIYLGLDLLALGSAVWIPNLFTGLGVVLMVLGSDLRGRAEEKVLVQAFGDRYREYCARTKRFLPGIY